MPTLSLLWQRALRASVVAAVLAGSVVTGPALGQAFGAVAPARVALAAAAPSTARLTKLVAEARFQTTLGIPYLYAGGHGSRPAALDSRVDCSGFVRELYFYAFGVDLGGGSGDTMIRLSGRFTRTGRPVPGDVVLLGSGGRAPAYHSGIYAGLVAGHPAMIASPTTGQDIRYQLGLDGYWRGDLMGYWHYNGATPADSGAPAPAVATPAVAGHFEAAVGKAGGLTVSGWVLDPQRPTAAAGVRIAVGWRLLPLTSRYLRPDVNQALRTTGLHGFVGNVGARAGWYDICLTAEPAGSSSQPAALGCRVVHVY